MRKEQEYLVQVSRSRSIEPCAHPDTDCVATVLDCVVDGDESPEASLRKADALAFEGVYCKTGCDAVVNHAKAHSYATKLPTLCTVEKVEQDIKPNTNTSSKKQDKGKDGKVNMRDITDYIVGKATFRLGCFSQSGHDFSWAAAEYIELDMSICSKSS